MTGESCICGQCGEPIIGEDPAQRKPCPKCGSTTRNIAASLHAAAAGSVTVQEQIVTYPRRLMAMARSLIDEGQDENQFSLAVVITHTACEIATERTLSELFVAKGIQYLAGWVSNGLNGYNLSHDRVRSLYTALTGDGVQRDRLFWQKFKYLVKRRNRIVHRGVMVGKAEAEDSYKVASDLLTRLKR